MVLFTLQEIVDLVIMTVFIGYLFSDFFKPKAMTPEMVYARYERKRSWFDWDRIWFAAAVTAPGIILHEMGHKFMAMAFGLGATFHAFYANSTTLFFGVLALMAKLMNFGFFFIVPGFVSITPGGTNLQQALIAFAGPGVNLLIWFVTWLLLRFRKFDRKWTEILVLTKRINLFLFIFNMLPIPMFDGFHFFYYLYHAFF